jgi:peroxiredoxin
MLSIAALSCIALTAGCVKEQSLKMDGRAPEISAIDLNDRTVKLSDFNKKVVLLRFWSSGCKACVANMPVLDTFSRKYQEKGFIVLAVNMGDSKEEVEKFAKSLNISYPVLLDPARITAQKYRVTAVPTTIIIDRSGIAKKRVAGEMTREQLEKTVRELLNGKTGQPARLSSSDLRDDVRHHLH